MRQSQFHVFGSLTSLPHMHTRLCARRSRASVATPTAHRDNRLIRVVAKTEALQVAGLQRETWENNTCVCCRSRVDGGAPFGVEYSNIHVVWWRLPAQVVRVRTLFWWCLRSLALCRVMSCALSVWPVFSPSADLGDAVSALRSIGVLLLSPPLVTDIVVFQSSVSWASPRAAPPFANIGRDGICPGHCTLPACGDYGLSRGTMPWLRNVAPLSSLPGVSHITCPRGPASIEQRTCPTSPRIRPNPSTWRNVLSKPCTHHEWVLQWTRFEHGRARAVGPQNGRPDQQQPRGKSCSWVARGS